MRVYLPILCMIVLVVLFASLSFVASKLLGPKRPTSAKQAPYECGIVPEYEPAERFPVKFYLVAMAFIVLDVEIVFLYPFTTVFRGLGAYGLIMMGIFLLVLLVPFAYLLSTGALEWGPVKQATTRVGATILRAVGAPGRDGLDPAARRARRKSISPTNPGRPRSGTRVGQLQLPHRARRRPRQLGAQELGVARDLRARVLRDRDDGRGRRALRPVALGHGDLPGQPAPGRPHDRRRSRQPEDGPGAAPGLRPDGRAQVGHLDGRVREQRRDVQQLRDRPGRRPGGAGRRLRPRAARPGPRRSCTASSPSTSRSRTARSSSAGRVAGGGGAAIEIDQRDGVPSTV